MTRIERSIEINRPPEEVFNLMTDLHQHPQWSTTVAEAHDIPDGPFHNGSNVEHRNEREADHSLDNLKDMLEGRS